MAFERSLYPIRIILKTLYKGLKTTQKAMDPYNLAFWVVFKTAIAIV